MTSQLFTRDGTALEPTTAGGRKALVANTCHRCGGAGGADAWKFTGWKCYRCGGSGREVARLVNLYTAEELATLNARKAKADAKRQSKRDAAAAVKAAADEAARLARADMLAADPIFAFLSANAGRHEFLGSMLDTLSKRDLADNQRAAVQKWIDADVAKAAKQAKAKAAGHVGRVGERCAIDAVVVATKWIAKGYAYGSPDRYLIKAETTDGAAIVWFSAFREVGSRLVGTAMIEKQDDYNGTPQTQIKNFRASKKVLEEGLSLAQM